MKPVIVPLIAFTVLVCLLGGVAMSHFQVLIPSADIVSTEGDRNVDFNILFTHPMAQGPVMEMGVPRAFGVLARGSKQDLLGSLEVRKVDGKTTYTSTYKVGRPGDHVFFLEPAPYWEPAERKMILHYTKVVVDGLGAGEGWDGLVGFPVEIEPLVRPYGLWTGNVFRGIVKHQGKPVPFARIEVEFYNEGLRVAVPSEAFVTQVIKADSSGAFTYAMPTAGWWSFAALVDGEPTRNPDGKMVATELGGLIWVRTVDMKSN